MCEVTINIPDHALVALNVSPEHVGNELRLAAAVKLFELGRLSSGAAAELAGVPKPLFMLRLGEYGVDAFRMTKDDFDQEAPIG